MRFFKSISISILLAFLPSFITFWVDLHTNDPDAFLLLAYHLWQVLKYILFTFCFLMVWGRIHSQWFATEKEKEWLNSDPE